ncbi:hypothetical protein LKO27_03750 [Tessaracoccus sp. OS52]|uniref:hypothetical protein n=1 Tax=Tessaracoccus sp. OS52 TaxID=2886691 RepID=UPI001D10CC55|nr:hypothetical protein [Tessaracoccus sp. OS52]MCC2592534.1 hypothetical protein [Tessaracoccus sp. OS52]
MDGLHSVADAIREEVESYLHTIDKALELHPAYRETQHITSEMVRSLVVHAARSSGGEVRLPLASTLGGFDLVWSDDHVFRKYRVKKATRNDESGEFEMLVGPNSGLLTSCTEPDPLFAEEQWVFGYTVSPLRTIDEVFVAEVLGSTAAKVGHLLLGTPIVLARTAPPDDGRFHSDEEDHLPGYDEGLFGWGNQPEVAR